MVLGLVRGGFPDSSVGKESTCNAADPSSIPGLGTSAGEGIGHPFQYSWASLVSKLVKNPPTMWETWVQYLGCKDPLEKGTHSNILAWRIPGWIQGEFHGWVVSPTWWIWFWAGSGSWWWTGKPGMLQSMGMQRAGHDWATELNWTWLEEQEGEGAQVFSSDVKSFQCPVGTTLGRPLTLFRLYLSGACSLKWWSRHLDHHGTHHDDPVH